MKKRVLTTTLALALAANYSAAVMLYSTSIEDMATGTISTAVHPDWVGMAPENGAGADPADWSVINGGGLDYTGPDGGFLSGGDKYISMKSIGAGTGRLLWNFAEGDTANALPTYDPDNGASVYYRVVWMAPTLENIVAPEDPSIMPSTNIRVNQNWSYKYELVLNGSYWSASSDVERFYIGMEQEDGMPGGQTGPVAFADDPPEAGRVYMVIGRMDFDTLGLFTRNNVWIDPAFNEKDTPHATSLIKEAARHDSFLDPLILNDFTTYNGTMTFDNIAYATSWEALVPQPGGTGDTWLGYPVTEDGDVNTGGWMGWVNVLYAPYVLNYNLGGWVYVDESYASESGAWVYVFNF